MNRSQIQQTNFSTSLPHILLSFRFVSFLIPAYGASRTTPVIFWPHSAPTIWNHLFFLFRRQRVSHQCRCWARASSKSRLRPRPEWLWKIFEEPLLPNYVLAQLNCSRLDFISSSPSLLLLVKNILNYIKFIYFNLLNVESNFHQNCEY